MLFLVELFNQLELLKAYQLLYWISIDLLFSGEIQVQIISWPDSHDLFFDYFSAKIFIACGGQTPSQAKQNMQSDSRAISGFFSDDTCPGVSNHS